MSDRLEYYGEDGTHYVLEAIDDGAQLTIEQLTDVELPGLVLTQQMSWETLKAVLAMARELLGSADDRRPATAHTAVARSASTRRAWCL
jgi:hypothetical protein